MVSINHLISDLSDLKINEEKLKISAFTSAARISHLVSETTLGPAKASIDKQPIHIEHLKPTTSSLNTTPSTTKWRNDTWYQIVDADSSYDDARTTDFDAVRFRMALINLDKKCKIQARKEVTERQAIIEQTEKRLQYDRRESLDRARHIISAKHQQKSLQIRRIGEQYEEAAKRFEDEMLREMSAHKNRVAEKTRKLQRNEEICRLRDLIIQKKSQFNQSLEEFVSFVLNNQQYFTEFTEYSKLKDRFLEQYDNLMKSVNSQSTTETEFALQFDTLILDVRKANSHFEKVVQQAIKYEQEKEQNSTVVLPVESPLIHNPSLELTSLSDHIDSQVPALEPTPVHIERKVYYAELYKFFDEFNKKIDPLICDLNLKKFRFECHKAVNIPMNAIAAVNREHLMDKYVRLSKLLRGQTVRIDDNQFTANGHPLGIDFCALLIAKKFIHHGETIVSSDPESAFPLAAILVALWQDFPIVGQLFLCYMYKMCPYLVPIYFPHTVDQSMDEYLKLMGHRYSSDGILEDDQIFLKRMGGIARLYGAVFITKSRQGQQAVHPHNLGNCWKWLANTLNLEPLPNITATVLVEILQVSAFELHRSYGRQFWKLIYSINQQYIGKLIEIKGGGGPCTRFSALISQYINDQRIEPPKDALPTNFW